MKTVSDFAAEYSSLMPIGIQISGMQELRDDVGFGLENIGVPSEEMPARIEKALNAVGMLQFIDRAPHMLSGGQKQRVAIAGILAMQPRALILDEATAMLDPKGRQEVFDIVQRLNREQGITVVWITHFMEEAARCERVIVMHEGRCVMYWLSRY